MTTINKATQNKTIESPLITALKNIKMEPNNLDIYQQLDLILNYYMK
jgi:hypothetical protein